MDLQHKLRFLLFLLAFFMSCQTKKEVDLIIYNAKVYTVDSILSISKSFAVKDGKTYTSTAVLNSEVV